MERARALQGGPVPRATPTSSHPHLLPEGFLEISPSWSPFPFLLIPAGCGSCGCLGMCWGRFQSPDPPSPGPL